MAAKSIEEVRQLLYEVEELTSLIKTLTTLKNSDAAHYSIDRGTRQLWSEDIPYGNSNSFRANVFRKLTSQIINAGIRAFMTDQELFENSIDKQLDSTLVRKILLRLLQQPLNNLNEELKQINVQPIIIKEEINDTK
jgi:hypothetical protein